MTIKFLLDTDVVSAPISKRPCTEIVRRLERHGHECAIAAPVWHELVYGVRRLPAGKRRTALMAYVDDVVGASFPILAYDDKAGSWHGRERVRLEKKGRPAPQVDGQIASIAHTNGLVLVTLNPRDFAMYRGLEVQDWSSRGGRG